MNSEQLIQPTDLQKAIERLEMDMSKWDKDNPFIRDFRTLLSAAKRLQDVEKERDEFEHRIIEFACKGTGLSRFESVAEMQVAQLYKWWKESEQERDALKAALRECAKALQLFHKTAIQCILGDNHLVYKADKAYEEALSNPTVQQALKESQGE